MASPFPGMDPYLEEFWGDVHTRLVLYTGDQLQDVLPRDLRARVQERVFVDAPSTGERDIYPDVRIVERGRGSKAAPVVERSAAQPLILRLDQEPITEPFIEIIDIGSGRRVVTAIEVLSLANKRPGAGREAYLKKQTEVLEAHVSLVEIDFLRAGQWTLAADPRRIPQSHRTPYRVLVRRGWQPSLGELYAVTLRQRLPPVNIPLRETDKDAVLDLQVVLEQAYHRGGYQDDLDYEGNPEPPLEEADSAWADALLRERGLRLAPPKPPRRPRQRRKD